MTRGTPEMRTVIDWCQCPKADPWWRGFGGTALWCAIVGATMP